MPSRSQVALLPEAARTVPATLGIVIVAYRCDELLRACLASLLAAPAPKLQVIVVDNASSPATRRLVEGYATVTSYVDAGGNVGFAKASNIGAAALATEYVLFLNPDTIVPAHALRLCVSELARRPDVGILGCKLVRADGSFDHAAKRGLPTPAASLAYLVGLDRLAPRQLGGYCALGLGPDETGSVAAVNGAFMLMRRSTFEAVGGFDEDFWMYGEDLDLCLRVSERGQSVLYWPGATVRHLKGGASSGRASSRVDLAFYASMRLFFDKHLAPTRALPTRMVVRAGIGCLSIASRFRRRLSGARLDLRSDADGGAP